MEKGETWLSGWRPWCRIRGCRIREYACGRAKPNRAILRRNTAQNMSAGDGDWPGHLGCLRFTSKWEWYYRSAAAPPSLRIQFLALARIEEQKQENRKSTLHFFHSTKSPLSTSTLIHSLSPESDAISISTPLVILPFSTLVQLDLSLLDLQLPSMPGAVTHSLSLLSAAALFLSSASAAVTTVDPVIIHVRAH
jgi:hypothetical protein